MALVLLDRVQQTGTANTTVSFTVTGSVAGYQSWSAVGNGNTTYYGASDSSGNWEVGLATYSTTGPTVTRTTIFASSNAGAAVTFSGTVNVWVDYPATKAVYLDASSNVSPLGTITSGTWNAGVIPVTYGGTNSTATPTNGGVVYGTGTAMAVTAAGTSGQVLQSNGASAPTWASLAISGRLLNIQYFTVSGTYTPTTGTNSVVVEVVGGGGGSGGNTTAGGAGGTSSFGALVSATGGAGGANSSASSKTTSGGVGSSGDINLSGGNAGSSIVASAITIGGNSFYAPATISVSSNAAGVSYGGGAAGGTSTSPAGGGGGGGFARKKITSAFSGVTVTVGAGGTASTGGILGASGIVIVYEYS